MWLQTCYRLVQYEWPKGIRRDALGCLLSQEQGKDRVRKVSENIVKQALGDDINFLQEEAGE